MVSIYPTISMVKQMSLVYMLMVIEQDYGMFMIKKEIKFLINIIHINQ